MHWFVAWQYCCRKVHLCNIHHNKKQFCSTFSTHKCSYEGCELNYNYQFFHCISCQRNVCPICSALSSPLLWNFCNIKFSYRFRRISVQVLFLPLRTFTNLVGYMLSCVRDVGSTYSQIMFSDKQKVSFAAIPCVSYARSGASVLRTPHPCTRKVSNLI